MNIRHSYPRTRAGLKRPDVFFGLSFRSLMPVIFLALLFLLDARVFSEDIPRDFFSVNRFDMRRASFRGLPLDRGPEARLLDLNEAFSSGLDNMDKGEFKAAEADLLKARRIWPEYCGTDFVLALLYERMGDRDTAARHYKGYLIKARKYRSGKYDDSTAAVYSLVSGSLYSPDAAQVFIKRKLRAYDIDLDQVSPVYRLPGFLTPVFLLLLFAVIVFVVLRRFAAGDRAERSTSGPVSGWVCLRCGADNPNNRKECKECYDNRPL